MNWVVPLVGCGGPAVSRCGHETRRHRVRGALFASVFASVLLAACGGGSGGNLTTSSEREPGPPGPDPLTATGGGRNESGEEQQQKIIVNQEEEQQQEIVVNIQPDPEESESEEESEEEENNNEETPQQLTIIEEVVPEYREPEKPKPTYSAQQQSQPESEEESEEEENNDEEQKIVVNIQPDPEESESEEESEEEENNNEETPQQLTIIEEVVPEYREPEKPKPTYSAQQQSQPESEEESEEEENNDEEQKIVVNIQPDPEESESEEESEEEENNNEETPQQLTIIEEVVPEYREPEKPKPTYSAQQQSQPESEEESEEEENNDEEQKIVVNIQPDPEESESEEQEEESEEEEEQQQQLTIIEEEDFPYVPPEEEEPRYSAATQNLTQTSSLPAPDPTVIDSSFNCMTNYVLDDCTPNLGPRSSSFTGTTINYTLENSAWTTTFKDLEGKDRGLQASSVARNVDFNPANNNYNFDYKNINRLKKVEVTYSKTNGFEGFYTYKGTAYGSSTATQKDDVTLKATFYNEEVDPPFTIEGSIGGSDGLTIGSTNFGNITFTAQGNGSGQFTGTNISFSNSNIRTEAGFNEVKGSFKNDGSSSNFPSQVVGELKMRRFFDQSPDKSSDEYRSNLYLRGENAIAGVFLADRGNEVVKEHQTSSQTPSQQTQTLERIDKLLLAVPSADIYGYWLEVIPIDNVMTARAGLNDLFLNDLIESSKNRGNISFPEFHLDNIPPGFQGSFPGTISGTYEGRFLGAYYYKEEAGHFDSDARLKIVLGKTGNTYQTATIEGFLGDDITMAEDDFYGFVINHHFNTEKGGFSMETPHFGTGNWTDIYKKETTTAFGTPCANTCLEAQYKEATGFTKVTEFTAGGPDPGNHGEGYIRGWVSEDGGLFSFPSNLYGEVKVKGFSKNGESGENNNLHGVFVTTLEEDTVPGG